MTSSVRFVNAGRLGKPLFRRGIFKLIRTFSFDSDKRKINKEINELKWRAYLLKKEINCIRSADICISFQLETTYMLSQMLCVEAPIITMFHQEPKVLLDKYPLEINCSALKISSAVVVLLPSYISQIKNICSEASVVAIPNALPIFERTSTLREKKIVCVGRVDRQKRVHLLIGAFALIKDRIPEWVVEYWGDVNLDPKYKKELFRLRHELGVEDKFHFCGITGNIERVLSDASIFAFPSASEGFPLALGEAMAKGLPVIGCIDCSGTNAMIIDGVNGFLAEPTAESVARALECLANNYELRLKFGKMARDGIRKCSPNNIWSIWCNLIFQIVNK